MWKKLSFVCVIVAALLSTEIQAADPAPRKKPLDTSFIASDSFVVVVCHPRQMLQYPPKNSRYIKHILALIEKETAIQIENLDQFVMQVGVPPADDPDDFEEAFAIIFRFAKPVDRDRIREKLIDDCKVAVHDGKRYFRDERGNDPSGYFHDDRTLVMAKEKRLLQLMNERQSMGPIVHRLRSIDSSNDIVIVGNFRADRDVTQKLAKEMFNRQLPLELVGALDTGTLTAKFSRDIPIRMDLKMSDEKAALGVKKWGTSLLALGRQAFPDAKREFRQSVPGWLGDESVEAIDRFLNASVIDVEGDQVHAALHAKGGLPQVVEMFTLPFIFLSGGLNEPPDADAPADEPEAKVDNPPEKPADAPRKKKD